MFTLASIQRAHAKIKSGADFPSYIQDLADMCIRSYVIRVSDSHTEYQGNDGYSVASLAKYSTLSISDVVDKDAFVANLKKHQQGGSDYLTFCQHCAEAGIAKRVVNIDSMSCTYYDLTEHIVLVEIIPSS